MTAVFLKLLNSSITVSWVVLAVFLLRLCLKKAPKWITCLLWGAVGLRLLLPFSVESGLSLIPSGQTIPQDIAFTQNPGIYTGIQSVDKAVNPVITEKLSPQVLTGASPLQQLLQIGAILWILGVAAMLLYAAVSTIRLHRSVRASLKLQNNVYQCDDVDIPFILGIFRPRIYLPSGLDPKQIQPVIAHEKAHLQRKDHWWKPLGFLLLALHWFNPLLWAAYILLCRDIEMACDEKAIRIMDEGDKKAYLEALAECGTSRRAVIACPLAFGEVGVKERIKAVLDYKRPTVWILAAAGLCLVALVVFFLTDPLPCEHVYHGEITLAATCTAEGVETFTCENCARSYTQPVAIIEHSYDALGQILTAPTCTAPGSCEKKCTVCDAKITEEVEKIPHTYGEAYVSKEPNCLDPGEKSAVCSACQGTFVVEQLPTNDVHDMKTETITAATCTANGQQQNACQRCAHTESVTLEALGHNYVVTSTTPSTCTHKGTLQRTCSRCSATEIEELPLDPDNHSWLSEVLMGVDECRFCRKQRSSGRKTVTYPSGNFYSNNTTANSRNPGANMWPTIQWD